MDAFFDMEFSMGKDRCDVISLACVIRDNDQIIDQFYTLTKPTKKLHWTAKRITKLKDGYEFDKSALKPMVAPDINPKRVTMADLT